jgi:hypothetical protein
MIMDTTNSTSGVQSLQKQGIGLLTMLALEYLLGIVTTLFVAFPENAAEDELWKFAMTQPILIVHMILALLIVFAGALLVWKAFASRHADWKKASLIGFIAVLIAEGSGAHFIAVQVDLYSTIMSTGFLVAFITYGWGLYRAK